MSDTPLAGWRLLIVGHQWPNQGSLNLISTSAGERRSRSLVDDLYADTLQSIRVGQLATQEGITSESIKNGFESGESISRRLAAKNRTKADAYRNAAAAARALQEELRAIAEYGERRVEDVLQSTSTAPEKVQRIVDIVVESQSQANTAAARHSNNVIDAVQTVLESEGLDMPARRFAADSGVSVEGAFSSGDTKELQARVSSMVNAALKYPLSPPDVAGEQDGPTSQASPSDLMNLGRAGIGQPESTDVQLSSNSPHLAFGQSSTAPSQRPSSDYRFATNPVSVDSAIARGDLATGSPRGTGQTPVSGALSAGQASAPSLLAPDSIVPSTTVTAPSRADASNPPTSSQALPTTGGPGAISPLHPTGTHPSDATRAPHYNTSAHPGTPVSAGAEAIINSATSLHATLASAPSMPLETAIPASGTTLFETAHAASPTVEAPPTSAPAADLAHPVVAPAAAVPSAPAAPPFTPPAIPNPTPAAGLLGYGTDLRPPVATPTPAPPAAAPGSAPATPAGGAAGLGQTAVVRQSQVSTTPVAQSPAVLAESAIAATGTGAATGIATTRAQAENRLTRLLHAVARQEPRLRWAIGDRGDGTTALATDLAGGWSPPDIGIPAGVTLLAPAKRNSDLETLISPGELIVSYSPGDYLPSDDDETLTWSIRARDTPAVTDLAWDLAQATKWRDGLPRLAHTLAKAVFARSGFLDNEVELLGEHMAAVGTRVLAGYPDDVSRDDVGNWQLLATIEALVNGHNTVANYHFAWFRAQAMTPEGQVRT